MTPPRPSLMDRLALSSRMRTTLLVIAIALAISLTAIALGATWRSRTLHAATQRLAADDAGAARRRVTALADAFARPTLVMTLAELADHLPPDTALATAERTVGGAFRIQLDTPDPDALRAALAADPWLERFRERAEDQREDGGFRITLESLP